MIEHVWSVLCSNAIVDSMNNNVSLINVIEQVTLPGNPPQGANVNFIPVPLVLVSLWRKTDVAVALKGETRTIIVSPSGTEKESKAIMVIELSEYERCRTFGRMNGIEAREPGNYFFKVQLRRSPTEKWEDVVRLPLQIRYQG